jgi:hypothetical protein
MLTTPILEVGLAGPEAAWPYSNVAHIAITATTIPANVFLLFIATLSVVNPLAYLSQKTLRIV